MSSLDAGSPFASRSVEEMAALRGPSPAPLAPRLKSTPPLVSPRSSSAPDQIGGSTAVRNDSGVVWQPPAVTLKLDPAADSNMVIEIDQVDSEEARNERIMRRLFGEVRVAQENGPTACPIADSPLDETPL